MTRDSKNKEAKRKGGLGRGIEALFGDEPQVEETEVEEEVQDISLDEIRPILINQERILMIKV